MIFSLLLSQQVVEFFEKCLMYSVHEDKHLMTLNWNWVLVFVGYDYNHGWSWFDLADLIFKDDYDLELD